MRTNNHLSIFLRILNDPGRKPLLAMFLETAHLWRRNRHFPKYYFTRHLFLRESGDFRDYLSTREIFRIIHGEKIHDEAIVKILSDKIQFGQFCEEKGIPAPRMLGYSEGRKFTALGNTRLLGEFSEVHAFFKELFAHFKVRTMILKTHASKGGKGIYILEQTRLEQQLSDHYQGLMQGSYVFQELIENHPQISNIYGHSLNSLRVDVACLDGDVHVLGAAMRIGRGGNRIDNVSSGGLYVSMDHRRGTLLKHGTQSFHHGGHCFECHPDTGFRFEGFEVPFYEEAIDLVKHLTRLLPNRIIGWDIGITGSGPFVIEGNHDPGIYITEVAHKGYRKHPKIRRLLQLAEE